MASQEFYDLGELARKRTRESAMSVAQLLDDDQEKAALLVACAIDFISGAAFFINDDDASEEEALGFVLKMIFTTIGPKKIADALKSARREK